MFAKEREVADNVNLSTAGFGFLSLGMWVEMLWPTRLGPMWKGPKVEYYTCLIGSITNTC
jgi:hypothetical protein